MEHWCPICTDDFADETDLRMHLEVEHRKSELARELVDSDDHTGEPITDSVRDESESRNEELTRPPV